MPRKRQALPRPVIEKRLAELSLYEFLKQGWHVLHSDGSFIGNWHIEAICQHLEAAYRGEISRLLINVPPGSTKSLSLSVFWPAWVWIHQPDRRFIFASYALDLAKIHSDNCRDLVSSDWYQERWGSRVRIRDDQNTQTRFFLKAGGGRLSASTTGRITGFHGDFLCVDDPHNASEIKSDTKRKEAIEFHDKWLTSRRAEPKKTVRVNIMQRLKEDDLSGVLLDRGGWEHLCLPMEFDPERHCETSIGFKDPRVQKGELLWPDRFDEGALQSIKDDMGSTEYAGQYQQSPAPPEGAFFFADRVTTYENIDESRHLCRGWDKASLKDSGDWTVGVKMAKLKDGRFAVLDISRGQWTPGRREATMRQIAELDGPSVTIKLEQEPGSGGKESAEASVRNLSGFHVKYQTATGSKMERAQGLATQIEHGNVIMRKAAWNRDFIEELRMFPNGKHDDQVDAAVLAFNQLAQHRTSITFGPD